MNVYMLAKYDMVVLNSRGMKYKFNFKKSDDFVNFYYKLKRLLSFNKVEIETSTAKFTLEKLDDDLNTFLMKTKLYFIISNRKIDNNLLLAYNTRFDENNNMLDLLNFIFEGLTMNVVYSTKFYNDYVSYKIFFSSLKNSKFDLILEYDSFDVLLDLDERVLDELIELDVTLLAETAILNDLKCRLLSFNDNNYEIEAFKKPIKVLYLTNDLIFRSILFNSCEFVNSAVKILVSQNCKQIISIFEV